MLKRLRFLLHLLAPPTLVALSGCVFPIGPEWSDPQSNYPPTISSANPPIGSTLGGDADGGLPAGVEVVLADQNTADILYVRWIVDYPPFDPNLSRVALAQRQPGGKQLLRPAIRYAPNCNDDAISRDSPNHRLLLAVTDRPFASGDDLSQPPLDAPNGDYLVEGSWNFVLTCP
jgi:hypothetical protein